MKKAKTSTKKLTVEDVAALTHLHVESIWRHVRNGHLPFERVAQPGRKPVLRFNRADVIAWTDANNISGRTEPATTPSPVTPMPDATTEPIPANQIDRVHQAELEAWKSFCESKEAGRPCNKEFRLWLKWCQQLGDAERACLKNGSAQRAMSIECEEAGQRYSRAWVAGVKQGFNCMIDDIARRANPSQPDIARASILDIVESQFFPMLDRPVIPNVENTEHKEQ